MRTAPADIALKGLGDFNRSRNGVLPQESHAAHDHARSAVGALEGAGIEKGLLHGMQPAVAFQSFDGGDGFSGGGAERHLAGTPSHTAEAEFVAKDRKKRRVGISIDGVLLAVYVE